MGKLLCAELLNRPPLSIKEVLLMENVEIVNKINQQAGFLFDCLKRRPKDKNIINILVMNISGLSGIKLDSRNRYRSQVFL